MFRFDLTTILIRALVLFTAMPIHECAHGWVASKLGDQTARSQGRLTLNPFHHLDPFGSVMLLVAGVGWAKPVPVNPYYFNKMSPRAGMAITALAGPVSNLLLALISLLIAKGFMLMNVNMILISIFITMCQINLTLAVFNLLPVHPLDGSRVLAYFLPDRILDWIDEHEQIIYLVFMGLILFTPILDKPMAWLTNMMFTALNWLTSLVTGF